MHRGELQDEYLQASMLGAHGSATSIMLAIGSDELAAAAADGDGDGRMLANFWYLPGDFTAAVADADAAALEGEAQLDLIALLAVSYRADSGEVLFRLACERRVIKAIGDEWNGLSLPRRNAWKVFGIVANLVYDVLLEASTDGAVVVPIRAPALEETIFDEDNEPAIDPIRAKAAEMMAKPPEPAKKRKKKSGDLDQAPLSIVSPAAIELPPETENQSDNASD